MKSFLTLLLVCLCVHISTQNEAESKAFADWKINFKKSYKSKQEENEAFHNFCDNLKATQAQNEKFKRGKSDFQMALWENSDQHVMTFDGKFNGAEFSMEPRSLLSQMPQLKASIIDSLNYVDLGYVNAVQNQKKCGSCYTFAACGVLEAQLFKKTRKLVKLSEQQLLSCTGSGYSSSGCKGGVVRQMFQYIKDNGITTSDKFPYNASDTVPCKYDTRTSVSRVNNFYWAQNIDEVYLKNLLTQVGPVAITIDASRVTFMNYKSGVYSDPSCTGPVNHAMLLVGYGVDPKLGDYWLLKVN